MLSYKPIFRVLLADDDEDDSFFFSEAVKYLPYHVILCLEQNGELLLEHLEKDKLPDILFLDLAMPGKDGAECLHAIRENKELGGLPVIIYSISNEQADIDTCYNEKANFYVVKPWSFHGVIQQLKNIFSIDWKNTTHVPAKEDFVLRI